MSCGCRKPMPPGDIHEHPSGAVAPLDAEVVQVGDAIWQRAERRGLVQGAVRPVRVVEALVLAQDDHQVALVPIKVRSSSSRGQLAIQRSMIELDHAVNNT